RDGLIVDGQGRVLGTHEGIHRFTVGQRKGLGLSYHSLSRRSGEAAKAEPMYVLSLRPVDKQIVVGPKASLERTTLTASGVNWMIAAPAAPLRASAQIRHRHHAAPAAIRAIDASRAEV